MVPETDGPHYFILKTCSIMLVGLLFYTEVLQLFLIKRIKLLRAGLMGVFSFHFNYGKAGEFFVVVNLNKKLFYRTTFT